LLIVNDFRTSMAALEIDTPQLRATQLVARPGTLPTLVFPVTRSLGPDVDGVWDYLRAPAEFFGVPMPGRDELGHEVDVAIAGSTGPALTAVTVTIAEADGSPQILVSSTPVIPWQHVEVRLAGADPTVSRPHPADPWWRRMAARTTSRGADDQLERWLNGRGYADAVAGVVPLLGAVVFETGSGVVGVENPEPTSVLDQLERCGAIATIARADVRPVAAARAWWISPRYETHPVVEIDGTTFPVDTATEPPFGRWS
jgi:hypothetical protein